MLFVIAAIFKSITVYSQINYVFKSDLYTKNRIIDTGYYLEYKYIDSNVNGVSYVSLIDVLGDRSGYMDLNFTDLSLYDTIINPFNTENFTRGRETIIIKKMEIHHMDSLKQVPLLLEWYKPFKLTEIDSLGGFEYEYFSTDYCCFDSNNDSLSSIIEKVRLYSKTLSKNRIVLHPVIFVPLYKETNSCSFGKVTDMYKNVQIVYLK